MWQIVELLQGGVLVDKTKQFSSQCCPLNLVSHEVISLSSLFVDTAHHLFIPHISVQHAFLLPTFVGSTNQTETKPYTHERELRLFQVYNLSIYNRRLDSADLSILRSVTSVC